MGTARTHCPDCESQALWTLRYSLQSEGQLLPLLRLPMLVVRAQGGRRARDSRCLRQPECLGGEEQGRVNAHRTRHLEVIVPVVGRFDAVRNECSSRR
jgi:hypothetical protein